MTDKLKVLQQQGYARIKVKDELLRIEEALDINESIKDIFLVVDRIIVKDEEDFLKPIGRCCSNRFFEGKGECIIENFQTINQTAF